MRLRFSGRALRLWSAVRLPVAVFVAGAALSIGASVFAWREIAESASLRLDSGAASVSREVKAQFEAYTEVLIGLRALFNSTSVVGPGEFHDYVKGLELQRTFPGFEMLNYAPYVPPGDKLQFQERMRAQMELGGTDFSTFTIGPPGDRPGYYPMTFIEPAYGNEIVFGQDLASIPQALAALEAARDSGRLSSAGKMVRLGERGSLGTGLTMRLAVYAAGAPQATVEQRRAAYLGSVGAAFTVAAMMRDILDGDGPSNLRLRLYDGGVTPRQSAFGAENDSVRESGDLRMLRAGSFTHERLLYDSSPTSASYTSLTDSIAVAHSRRERALAFDLGGRAWVVHVSTDQAGLSGLDSWTPWLILFGGLVISALLAGFGYSMSTSRARALSLATAMTRELHTSKRRLDEAQHLASLGSWVFDQKSGQLHCSSEALRIFGLSGSETPSLSNFLLRVAEEDRALVRNAIDGAMHSTDRREFEHRLRLDDGSERWVHVIVQRAEEDGHIALRGTVRDDTQRKRDALRLQLEHQVARLLASDDANNVVLSRVLEAIGKRLDWECGAYWRATAQGRAACGLVWANGRDPGTVEFIGALRSLSFRTDSGLLGRAWAEGEIISSGVADETMHDPHCSMAARAGLKVCVVVPVIVGDRHMALEFFSRQALAAAEETIATLRAVALQIGQYEQRKRAEVALHYIASHDELTGLANRSRLHTRLSESIRRSERSQRRLAVVFLDLDRFKHINDTFGHGVGDDVLRNCAERLAAVLREGDTVARFGGDEFVLILEDLDAPEDAVGRVDEVLACCARPFVVEGRELHITASAGISLYPDDGADAEALLKNADTAMYRAKDRGRSTQQFYAAHMNSQGEERFVLEGALRRAIAGGELALHYQPKLCLRTRTIVGVEALMRWNHPRLGPISPVQFIPIAEETGLIEPMGKWALQVACADARRWEELGLPAVQMSVNLSVRQLKSPTLLADIAEVLAETGMDPSMLELEITESAMMQNPQQAETLFQQLRTMGVQLAIDDFGTGYSSLSYLQRFPLTSVKVDRSFVKDLPGSEMAVALTKGIIELAHGLHMHVVAEGVETEEQQQFLIDNGCDLTQGYLLCKPLPWKDVFEFMVRHRRQLVEREEAA